MIVYSIANILALITSPNSLSVNVLGACGSPALMAVAGSYLLIHLRESGEAGIGGGTSNSVRISTMNFAEDSDASGKWHTEHSKGDRQAELTTIFSRYHCVKCHRNSDILMK